MTPYATTTITQAHPFGTGTLKTCLDVGTDNVPRSIRAIYSADKTGTDRGTAILVDELIRTTNELISSQPIRDIVDGYDQCGKDTIVAILADVLRPFA